MGRPPGARKRSLLPGAGPKPPIEADIGACPSPRRASDARRRRIDNRWRHFVARQGRGRRPEHDRFRRDIAKSAAPRRATPIAGAFPQVDFRPFGDALHGSGPGGRLDQHCNRRAGHREVRDRRPNKSNGKAKPKRETPYPVHSFVARHVGPFGPKVGSMRKLSLAVIAPRDKVSSGMTSVA
jgi:hypothetical protein